jgi:hypothetical protein
MVLAGNAALSRNTQPYAMACGGVMVDIHCRMEPLEDRLGATGVVKSDDDQSRRKLNRSRNASGPATDIRVE